MEGQKMIKTIDAKMKIQEQPKYQKRLKTLRKMEDFEMNKNH